MPYSIFNPKVNKPLHELTRKEARIAHNWFINNINTRIEELKCLVERQGVVLDFSEESLVDLHKWFCTLVVMESEAGGSEPTPELLSICNDIGMYISEIAIKKFPNIHWAFHTFGKKSLHYQRSVLMGFNVKNKNYSVDVDLILCGYAFRILKGNPPSENMFLAILDDLFSKAQSKS